MKKSILFLGLMLCIASITNAQVSFFVESPSGNEGGYEIEYTDISGGDWATIDMTDPANVTQGTMCLGQDSLACEPLINGADLVGKIAVVYRGACEFGYKALQAQNEGAIACIIINHSPGVVPMGGGVEGINVTIPVIMISNSDGALLHDEIAACTSTALIGNLNGYFEHNLRLTNSGVLRPNSYGQVAALNVDDTEFEVQTGAWVYNLGQGDEDNGVVNVSVDYDGSTIFDESSEALAIPIGDSVYVSLPTFSQGSYPAGNYDMNYTVTGTGDDGFTADNISPANFVMGDVFSFSRLNEANEASFTNHTSLGTPAPVGERNYCINFEDANADRVNALGMHLSGTNFTDVITDFDIAITVYEWLDDDAGLETTFEDINEVASQGYTFEDGEDDQIIYIPFDDPVELDNDTRYLFCITHENDDLQLGMDNKTNYGETTALLQRPTHPYFDESTAIMNLLGDDLIPAMSVLMDAVDGVEEITNDVDITPFPNPANEMLNIPFANSLRGNAVINIFNIEGQLVSSQQVNVNTSTLRVDVSSIANGKYVFNVVLENKQQSTFNVVVNR